MGAFASGKHAFGLSDRSGFRYRLKDMRKEWNGSLVGKDEYEEKHPQLTPPRVPTDPEALRNARPDRTETAVPNLLPLNAFSTTASSATVTVNEPNHGRSTSDTVRFRDAISVGGIAATTINSASGFTITNIDTNNYSFPSGVTATFTQKGGGGLASAGPTSITN
tara:strand:+ start:1469 stop:1963 length:495 start_codon:yes stop_codon:yes gene_type:complete